MKCIYFLMIALFCAKVMYANSGSLSASRLRCDYLENPQGIERLQPRLSWQMPVLPKSKGQKNNCLSGYCGKHQRYSESG